MPELKLNKLNKIEFDKKIMLNNKAFREKNKSFWNSNQTWYVNDTKRSQSQ